MLASAPTIAMLAKACEDHSVKKLILDPVSSSWYDEVCLTEARNNETTR